MIIAIEGLDGCGKSTVAALVAQKLTPLAAKHGYSSVINMGFPRREDSPTGKQIDAHLSGLVDYAPTTHQALQVCNRLEVAHELSSRDRIYVLARYTASAFVYGILDGLDPEWLQRVCIDPVPPADLQVLLAEDPAVCAERIRRRMRVERYEGERQLYAQDAIYAQVWSTAPRATEHDGFGTHWAVVDPNKRDSHAVADSIVLLVQTLFLCPRCEHFHNPARTPHAIKEVRLG